MSVMARQEEMVGRREARGGCVLVVDADASLGKFLRLELEAAAFGVEVVRDADAALQVLAGERRCDLVILDVNLPAGDGMSLIAAVRAQRPRLPMLVLTSRNGVEDKVTALHRGADDFVTKPFSLAELMARVQALLRRYVGAIPNVSEVGDLRLYREERRVERSGRRIDLTPREFAILEFMLRHVGRPVSRAELFEEVWQMPHRPSSNVVDVYMKYVRDKVDGPGDPKLTHTVRGFGYEFREA